MHAKILDCTLRDGGYCTNWDFGQDLVDEYVRCMSHHDIHYLEIGYRSPSDAGYKGEYFYLPEPTINSIAEGLNGQVEIAVMVNAKEINSDSDLEILEGLQNRVTLIRIAADPRKLPEGLELARKIKGMRYSVALNLMYLHLLVEDDSVLYQVADQDVIDYLYLVDSYGSVTPDQVRDLFARHAPRIRAALGFHGHDNIGLAFANSLAAVEGGASIVDSTVLGMGRGAGNLRTELMVAYASKQKNRQADFSSLANLTEKFEIMKQELKWGSSMPYIISGLENLPQQEIMDWTNINRYSTSTIIDILKDRKLQPAEEDCRELREAIEEKQVQSRDAVVLIGGGKSAIRHKEAIAQFAAITDAAIIHSSARNLDAYIDIDVPQFACLVGREADKILSDEEELLEHFRFLVARETSVQTYVPDYLKKATCQVDPFAMNDDAMLSPVGLAMGAAIALGGQDIYLAGFDGYDGSADAADVLGREVQEALDAFATQMPERRLVAITPTRYRIDSTSVYQRIA